MWRKRDYLKVLSAIKPDTILLKRSTTRKSNSQSLFTVLCSRVGSAFASLPNLVYYSDSLKKLLQIWIERLWIDKKILLVENRNSLVASWKPTYWQSKQKICSLSLSFYQTLVESLLESVPQRLVYGWSISVTYFSGKLIDCHHLEKVWGFVFLSKQCARIAAGVSLWLILWRKGIDKAKLWVWQLKFSRYRVDIELISSSYRPNHRLH